MARYSVVKDVRFTWQVEADDAEGAIATTGDLQPGAVEVLRQRARDLDRAQRTPAEKAITDRELRPGRKFVATRKGKEYRAFVAGEDGTIKVVGIDKPFKSLNAAGRAITGQATNAWRFFRDAPAEEPTPRKTTRKRTKQARPPTPRPATARARARSQGMRVDPPPEPTPGIDENTAEEHERNLARAEAQEQAI